MNKITTAIIVSILAITANTTSAAPVRITGSFGATVYSSKPIVELPWGSEWAIPANYAVSLSAQFDVLPHGLFVFTDCDRFWSGSAEQFTNSAYVFSAGIGHSTTVGYSKVEFFCGLSQYNETFEIWMNDGSAANIDVNTLDALAGMQLVFRFFDQVTATTKFRLIVRDEEVIESTLDDGRPIALKTNSNDFGISFGIGYEFGG